MISVFFNIYPKLFLQEIAILFIYYLFIGLLDLIDFENEKPWQTLADFLFPYCTHTRDEV